MAALHVSIPVEVKIKAEFGAYTDTTEEPDWEETLYLGWRKLAKDWRLCVGVLRDDLDGEEPKAEWKPITESPKEHRIELAEHYPKLKAKVKEARQKLVPQIAAAIALLKQALGD